MLKKLRHPDYFLLIILIVLSAFGFLILASVSAPLSYNLYGVTDFYLKHQIIFGLIPGLFLGIIAYFINIEWIRKNSFYIFIFILFLMAAVFLPVIGHSSGGAHRWIKLGNYTFQPAEFLKLFL